MKKRYLSYCILMQLLILLSLISNVTFASYKNPTVDGIQFKFVAVSDDGYVLYSCKECAQQIYGGTLDEQDFDLLELHAQYENSHQEVDEVTKGSNVFYIKKGASTGRCQHCGAGIRKELMEKHICIDRMPEGSLLSSSSASSRTPSWFSKSTTLTDDKEFSTKKWVDSSSSTAGSLTPPEYQPSISSTSSKSKTGIFTAGASSPPPSTVSTDTPVSGVGSLSLHSAVEGDSTLNEIRLLFPTQTLAGDDITVYSFERNWDGSKHVWNCVDASVVIPGSQVSKCPNGKMGSATIDVNNIYHFGIMNPVNEEQGKSGIAYVVDSSGGKRSFSGEYKFGDIDHQCKQDSGKKKHKHGKGKGKKTYMYNPPRFPLSTPYVCSTREGCYIAHHADLHTPKGAFAITRKTCHYLHEPLGCCAVETTQGTWVFASISPTQRHDDQSDEENNQRKFVRWLSTSCQVNTPPFGGQKATKCLYNLSLHGTVINDTPYLCYVGHQAYHERDHGKGRVFIVASPESRETEVATTPGRDDIHGVTPLSDKRILAFPCQQQKPQVGIYNPQTESWSYEPLNLPTAIPLKQYALVMTTNR